MRGRDHRSPQVIVRTREDLRGPPQTDELNRTLLSLHGGEASLNRALKSQDDPLNRTLLTMDGTGDVTAPPTPEVQAAGSFSARTATPREGAVSELLAVGADCMRLPAGNDQHAWIRRANGASDRAARLAAGEQTLLAAAKKGYIIEGESPVALSVDHVTRVIRAAPQESAAPTVVGEWLSSARETVWTAAERAFSAGKERVAVVNAASAFHKGGGFRSGGRHALRRRCA
jgi:hypothetical protein